jgi:hypothetical protein
VPDKGEETIRIYRTYCLGSQSIIGGVFLQAFAVFLSLALGQSGIGFILEATRLFSILEVGADGIDPLSLRCLIVNAKLLSDRIPTITRR